MSELPPSSNPDLLTPRMRPLGPKPESRDKPIPPAGTGETKNDPLAVDGTTDEIRVSLDEAVPKQNPVSAASPHPTSPSGKTEPSAKTAQREGQPDRGDHTKGGCTGKTKGGNGMKLFLWIVLAGSLSLNIWLYAQKKSAEVAFFSEPSPLVETDTKALLNEFSELAKRFDAVEATLQSQFAALRDGLAKGRESTLSGARSGQSQAPKQPKIQVGSGTSGAELLEWFGTPKSVVELPRPQDSIYQRARWDYLDVSFVMQEDDSHEYRVVSWTGNLNLMIAMAYKARQMFGQ